MSSSANPTKKCILIYGLDENQLMRLQIMGLQSGIRIRPVKDSEAAYTVAELLSGRELSPAEPRHLEGKYALLDGFGRNLGEATAILNRCSLGIVKSVRTEHNEVWPFSELCAAIQEEQDTIERMKKMKNS